MAQSTTIKNARVMSISIDGTDVCGSVQSIDWSDDREISSYFTACGDGARYLTGKRTISGTLNIYYSETAGEAYKLVAAAYENVTEAAIVTSPTGGNSGNEQFTMTVLFTGFPINLDPSSADAIAIAVPFVVQGVPTRAAVS